MKNLSKKGSNLQSIEIDNIEGGWNNQQYLDGKGQYDSSIGVNPDFALISQTKASGVICPVSYSKFSGSNITGFPLWLITDIKDNKIYAYASDGKFVSYSSSYTTETLIGTPTSGAGNGAAYYNNYLYLATPTDISRYGNLDGSPTGTNNWWTGILAALANTTYPSLRNTPIPNHPMHVHVDNTLYVGDVNSAGQGQIHRLKTSKGTVQGDTNNVSAYGALLLPFGVYPTDIESYGNDLAIVGIRTTNALLNQGESYLFLWDTTSLSFYNMVKLPDALTTAILNINGVLYIWGGNSVNGVRLSTYSGGNSVTTVCYLQEGTPPFAGAVDALGNQAVWGGWTTYPANSASVFSYDGVLHNIATSTSTGTTQTITALKFAQQSSETKPEMILGWKDDGAQGIDALSSTLGVTKSYSSVFRTETINVNQTFILNKIRIGLGDTIQTGVSIAVNVYLDDQSTVIQLDPINPTNFQGRYAIYKETDFQGINAQNNFMLEFVFGGSYFCPVLLPIYIDYEIYQDES